MLFIIITYPKISHNVRKIYPFMFKLTIVRFVTGNQIQSTTHTNTINRKRKKHTFLSNKIEKKSSEELITLHLD